jgi:hypothetical protein
VESMGDQLARRIMYCITDNIGKRGHVYAAKNEYLPGMVKIGFAKCVRTRLKTLSCAMPVDWELIDSAYVHHAEGVENAIHAFFSAQRVAPNRELFRLPDDAVLAALAIANKMDGVNVAEIMAKITALRPTAA